MSDIDALEVAAARAALESTNLSPRYWAVGEQLDDHCCLLRQEGRWVAGYFERGSFRVKFVETESRAAVTQFVMWVSSVQESTERSAQATAEWLTKHGKTRP